MGVFYETIPNSLVPWIKEQQMLWVGTAPLSGEGHINISPKGGQDFGILDERTFWYMDLTGSGVETHAHIHEPGNGRICVMVRLAYTINEVEETQETRPLVLTRQNSSWPSPAHPR
jgi:hypothetical protein